MMRDLKRKWPILAATAVVLIFGVMLLPKASSQTKPYAGLEPKRMSLEGTLVCLPHKAGVPPTKECNIGLRTEDGAYYALDLGLYSGPHDPYGSGDYVSGNGVFTPIERLSADNWSRYDIKGIFSVTDSFKVVK